MTDSKRIAKIRELKNKLERLGVYIAVEVDAMDVIDRIKEDRNIDLEFDDACKMAQYAAKDLSDNESDILPFDDVIDYAFQFVTEA